MRGLKFQHTTNSKILFKQCNSSSPNGLLRARGIIVLVESNQLVKKISRLNIFRKLKLDINPFLLPKYYKNGGRISLVVGYNIEPTSSSTNQNAALMIDHQFWILLNYFIQYFETHCLSSSGCYKLWLCETSALQFTRKSL